VRVCRLSESVVMIERPRKVLRQVVEFLTRLRGMGSSCKRCFVCQALRKRMNVGK
jgi:hypothetical protein